MAPPSLGERKESMFILKYKSIRGYHLLGRDRPEVTVTKLGCGKSKVVSLFEDVRCIVDSADKYLLFKEDGISAVFEDGMPEEELTERKRE